MATKGILTEKQRKALKGENVKNKWQKFKQARTHSEDIEHIEKIREDIELMRRSDEIPSEDVSKLILALSDSVATLLSYYSKKVIYMHVESVIRRSKGLQGLYEDLIYPLKDLTDEYLEHEETLEKKSEEMRSISETVNSSISEISRKQILPKLEWVLDESTSPTRIDILRSIDELDGGEPIKLSKKIRGVYSESGLLSEGGYESASKATSGKTKHVKNRLKSLGDRDYVKQEGSEWVLTEAGETILQLIDETRRN